MAVGALPFLVLNYGAEMTFILHTRLIMQKVEKDKAELVMNDIIKRMFSPEFLNELFRPQQLYSYAATKEIFKSLTETSVMHLSPVSMNKLFELMTMGVKYQVYTLRHPMELLEMTWTHMEELRRVIPQAAQENMQPVFLMLETMCSSLTHGDLAEIRKELLNFFLCHNTCISVLIEDGLQTQTGSFVLRADTVLPPLSVCEPPGSIRYYRNGKLDASDLFEHSDSTLRHPKSIPLDAWNPKNPATRMTRNGLNVYALSKEQPTTQNTSETVPQRAAATTATSVGSAVGAETASMMTGELNYLSRLVGGAKPASQQTFKLIFFDDMEEEADGLEKSREHGSATVERSTAPPNRMTKAGVHAQNKELFNIMSGMRIDNTTAKPKEEGNDLLDIMDEV